MSYSTYTDAQLWDAIRNNDKKAFDMLFDRHWPVLFTTAWQFTKDREICADITHDIFLNLWLNRHRLEIISVPHYLKAAARYHVYKKLRHTRTVNLYYTDQLETVPEKELKANAGEEKLRYLELEDTLNLHLSNLPKRCREIFTLSRREHLSNDEIANRLGISKRTVENQLTHALHYLRISLKELLVIAGILVHLLRK